jgi:ribosomal protein S18 acetylase RimI-like enzyme
LLALSLHVLKQAGMVGAELDADAGNLTGAVRLYERAGFRVRRMRISYRKFMRGG